MKEKRKNNIWLYVAFLAGLILSLYPTLSNRWNKHHQSQVVAEYTKEMEKIDASNYAELKEKAAAYNATLLNKQNRFLLNQEEKKEYESLLNVTTTGIMGYLEIPSIKVSVAVYHGVEQSVLQIAAGHVPGSSLPIGGENTHTVISGHRGLPSARLFTDLDKLKEGDEFILHVMKDSMIYKVDQIRVVTPEKLHDIQIEEGKDYCTLLTCTPYGVNSHRLLVRGQRDLEAEARAEIVPMVSNEMEEYQHLPLVPLMILSVILLILLLILTPMAIKKRREERQADHPLEQVGIVDKGINRMIKY